jgi:hypothetical protein
MFAPFHLLKIYIGIILYSLFPFSPSHFLEATTIRARKYARREVSFVKFLFCQVGLPNCMNAKLICQTVGVALDVLKSTHPTCKYV